VIAEKLETYIKENSIGSSRSRSRMITIKSTHDTRDKNGKIVEVFSSNFRKVYTVMIKGLHHGDIETSCSCPYNYEGICKHIVSVSNHLIEILPREPIEFDKLKWNQFSIESIIRFGFRQLKYENDFNRYGAIGSLNIDNTVCDEECKDYSIFIKCSDSEVTNEVQVKITDKMIRMRCDCNLEFKTKNTVRTNVCHHMEFSIIELANNHQDIFMNHPAILGVYNLKDAPEQLKNKAQLFFEPNTGFNLKIDNPDIFVFDEQNDFFVEIEANRHGVYSLHKHSNKDLNKNRLSIMFPEENELSIKGQKLAILMVLDYDDIIFHSIIGRVKKNVDEFSGKISVVSSYDLKKITDLEPERMNLYQSLKEINDIPSDVESLPEYYNFWKSNWSKIVEEDCFIKELSDKLNRKSIVKIAINPQLIKIVQNVYQKEYLIDINYKLKLGKSTIAIPHARDCIFQKGLFLYEQQLYLFESLEAYELFLNVLEQPHRKFHIKDKTKVYEHFLKPTESFSEINYNQKFKEKSTLFDYQNAKKQLYISQYKDQVLLKPVLHSDTLSIDLLSDEKFLFTEDQTIKRNKTKEKVFTKEYITKFPQLKNAQKSEFFHLNSKAFIENYFFLDLIEHFTEKGIEVFGIDELENFNFKPSRPSISWNISSQIDWFDIELGIEFDGEEIPLKEIQKAIKNGQEYVLLSDGKKGILPLEWLEKFRAVFRNGTIKKDKLEISKLHFSVLDQLFETLDVSKEIKAYKRKTQKLLQNFDHLKPVTPPKEILAELRDYQQAGLNWLNFLDDFQFGGCLADDMGLGKTLQMITFIQTLKTKRKNIKPHLIIVPTSLVYNWGAEIEKFCPSLKVLMHFGLKRQKDTQDFSQYDLIISTYGTVINDVPFLKKYLFEYIIIDESQAIKNPLSKRYKAVRLLKAKNRIALTGTPIENSLMDLYAQMSFVNPGLLQSTKAFKDNYLNPIEKEQNANAQNDLKTMIHPFLLRRTKEQVAKDLPEKTEQILYCSMGKKQEAIYKRNLSEAKKSILSEVEKQGVGKSKLMVLEALTKLRQICNSPQLVKESEAESVKIEELITAIQEKTGKHKILIFSQFVKMLHLIENRLQNLNISYSYLDGKTKNRQEIVDKFQEDDTQRVFLISLKAGGTGLNLTAADYVYIVDPWWNPAVENQAIDRTYRIGQEKNVTAYRMICKNTIEEKIIKLQERKKSLAQDFTQIEESFAKQLSKDDIVDLFS
jgi:non-specific serine/threonine protein kinase